LMRADTSPELQQRVHQMVTHRIVEVNFQLQFQGIQSGQGDENLYFELSFGNYLSIAIIRENSQLVALLLQSGCDPKVDVSYYIYKDGKKQGPVTSSQSKFARIVNKNIGQMLYDFESGLFLDVPLDEKVYKKKIDELKEIFTGNQQLAKRLFQTTDTLSKDFSSSIENLAVASMTHALYKK